MASLARIASRLAELLVVASVASCSSNGFQTLVAGNTVLSRIAVDAQSLYWTDFNQGVVFKVSTGGGSPQALATGQTSLGPLTVAGGLVFWGTSDPSGGGALHQAGLSGESPLSLATGNAVLGIAVQGGTVFWTEKDSAVVADAGRLLRAAVGGGPMATVASGLSLGSSAAQPSLLADANGVYWVDGSSVWKAPLDGGTPFTLASGAPVSLAIDESSAYWLNSPCQDGGLMKVPLQGGTPDTLAPTPVSTPGGCVFGNGAGPLAVDGANLYWFEAQSLMKESVAGGTPEVLCTDPKSMDLHAQGIQVSWGGAIALDATSVYVIDDFSFDILKYSPK